MAQRLLNKVAVVTGASGRLGRAIVQRFLGEGAKVVLFARTRGRLEELASLAPARILVVDGDVTKASDIDNLVQTTSRRFGGVDVLVPAAGVFRLATLEESTPELLAAMLDVNLHGALQTVRTFRKQMNPGAAVVFLSASRDQADLPGAGGFCASKAALSALARALAVELFPSGIRVNCVAPGPVDLGDSREATVSRMPGRAAARTGGLINDVAEAVLFLVSDAGANIVGQEIVVDQPRPRT